MSVVGKKGRRHGPACARCGEWRELQGKHWICWTCQAPGDPFSPVDDPWDPDRHGNIYPPGAVLDAVRAFVDKKR